MKIKSTVLFLFFSILAFGQSPEKFTYQSIIKNSSGYLLKNQEVGLRISILFNSSNGAEVYSEEHFPTSNSNGLVTVIIGEGLTGDNISAIDWGNGEYFIKVEVDPEGGINYTMNQTSQLLSVPYALYAENSGSGLNLLGQDFITLSNQTLTVNKVDLADDVDGILPITNGGTGSDTAPMVGVITAADEAAARSVLGLGTAATTASTDYATAAQGALADTALQDATAFSTAAQGAIADTALQASNNLSDLADAATSRTNLGLGTAATTASTDYATAAQGALADSAQQPPIEGAFTDGDKTKLDGIETSADVTDATNVLAAGAVMTTGDQTVAGAKTFSSTIVGDISGNAATATTLATARNIAGNAFDGSGNITIAAADLSDVTDAGSGAIITNAERTKLTNIETSADVTDATNVLAAGAVMTTGDQTVAGEKTFTSNLDVTGDTSVKGLIATGKVITPSGTTGNRTINSIAGSINFGSSDTSIRVTNSFVDENSVIILTKGSQGTSGGTQERKIWAVPNSSGYFDINVDFSFGNETKMYFLVIN